MLDCYLWKCDKSTYLPQLQLLSRSIIMVWWQVGKQSPPETQGVALVTTINPASLSFFFSTAGVVSIEAGPIASLHQLIDNR